MDFLDSVKHVFANYATFSGRAPRSEYWWWILFGFLAGIAAALLDMAFGTRSGPLPGLFGGILELALFLPGIAVLACRLHDINRSGWWQLIAFTIVGVIPLLIWVCRRGDAAANDYGPDPLGGPGFSRGIAGPGSSSGGPNYLS